MKLTTILAALFAAMLFALPADAGSSKRVKRTRTIEKTELTSPTVQYLAIAPTPVVIEARIVEARTGLWAKFQAKRKAKKTLKQTSVTTIESSKMRIVAPAACLGIER